MTKVTKHGRTKNEFWIGKSKQCKHCGCEFDVTSETRLVGGSRQLTDYQQSTIGVKCPEREKYVELGDI